MKVKKYKDFKSKCGVLFIDRLKVIKNTLDFLIYLSFSTFYTQAPNFEPLYTFTYIKLFLKIYW